MLAFSDAPACGGSGGIDPARIDYLLGEAPNWRFSCAVVPLGDGCPRIVGHRRRAGRVRGQRLGNTRAAVPVPAACIIALAAIPPVLGVLAANYGRRFRLLSAPGSEVLT